MTRRVNPVLTALLLAQAGALEDDGFDAVAPPSMRLPPMPRLPPVTHRNTPPPPPPVVRCPTEREMRAQARSWRKAARRLENAQRTAEGRARSRDRGKR